MKSTIIRQVKKKDLDGCYGIESLCYTTEGATKKKIKKRIEIFPQGFLVAEFQNKIIAMINSDSTNKEDISDEKLKNMVDHTPKGKNIVIFSLAVLPEFQKKGISKLLMKKFIQISKKLNKKKILLLCKEDLIEYYKKYGFVYAGKSKSKQGGFEWYEMYLPLLKAEFMKKDVVVKKSKIHRKGVFAGRNFRKGETILKWDLSVKLTKEEADKLPKKEKQYLYLIKEKYLLLQAPERFVNHSCEANTNVKDFCDVAVRDIKKGKEITGDYSKEEIPEFKMKCNCKSKNCKGTIKTG